MSKPTPLPLVLCAATPRLDSGTLIDYLSSIQLLPSFGRVSIVVLGHMIALRCTIDTGRMGSDVHISKYCTVLFAFFMSDTSSLQYRTAALSELTNDEQVYIYNDLDQSDLSNPTNSRLSYTLIAFKNVIATLLNSDRADAPEVAAALAGMAETEAWERENWQSDERLTFDELLRTYSELLAAPHLYVPSKSASERGEANVQKANFAAGTDHMPTRRPTIPKRKKKRTESSTQRASLRGVLTAGLVASSYFLSK